MTRALESIWPFSTPWRAQVGSAWCRLCHDSPMDSRASHHTLPDLSREAKGERPVGNFQVGIRYRPDLPAYFDLAVGRSLLATGDRFQVTIGMTWSTALKF